MSHETSEKHLYTIVFWALPKSGFDVAKKNAILRLLKEKSLDDINLRTKLELFESKHEGLVIYGEVIESDELITDPEISIMPIIQEKYSEATYIILIPMSHGEFEIPK
jgi:hypothetical protein